MNPPRKSNQGRRLIAILIQTVEIGIILMLGVAVFYLWQQLQASTQQTAVVQATVAFLEEERLRLLTQPTANPIVPTAMATVSASETTPEATAGENLIPFSDPNDPAALNSTLGWQPGGSPASTYDLTREPGLLTLVAGPGTDQWGLNNSGPSVALPVSGDFVVHVKLKTSLSEVFQRAGIGIRSTQDVNSWVNISRNYHSGIEGAQGIMVLANSAGVGSLLNNTPYIGESCFLKIERRGLELDLSYSEDGLNWVVLQENYVATLPDQVEIFLMASSTSSQGIVAQFSELTLSAQP